MHLVDAWKNSEERIKDHMSNFNQVLPGRKEEFEQFSKSIAEEIKNLGELRQHLEAKRNQLKEKKFCCIPILRSRSVRIASVLSMATGSIAAIGAFTEAFGESQSMKIATASVASVAYLLNGIGIVFITHSTFDFDAAKALLEINEASFNKAEKIQEFINQYQLTVLFHEALLAGEKGKAKEEILRDSNSSSSVHAETRSLKRRKSLDEEIANCIEKYDALDEIYKNAESYNRIISTLIQQLPETDPIREGINALVPVEIPHTQSNPEPFSFENYMEEEGKEKRKMSNSSSIISERDPSSAEWNGGEQTGNQFKLHTINEKIVSYAVDGYEENYNLICDQIRNRFLTNKTQDKLQFLEINGWRLSESGFTRANKTVSLINFSSSGHIAISIESPKKQFSVTQLFQKTFNDLEAQTA